MITFKPLSILVFAGSLLSLAIAFAAHADESVLPWSFSLSPQPAKSQPHFLSPTWLTCRNLSDPSQSALIPIPPTYVTIVSKLGNPASVQLHPSSAGIPNEFDGINTVVKQFPNASANGTRYMIEYGYSTFFCSASNSGNGSSNSSNNYANNYSSGQIYSQPAPAPRNVASYQAPPRPVSAPPPPRPSGLSQADLANRVQLASAHIGFDFSVQDGNQTSGSGSGFFSIDSQGVFNLSTARHVMTGGTNTLRPDSHSIVLTNGNGDQVSVMSDEMNVSQIPGQDLVKITFEPSVEAKLRSMFTALKTSYSPPRMNEPIYLAGFPAKGHFEYAKPRQIFNQTRYTYTPSQVTSCSFSCAAPVAINANTKSAGSRTFCTSIPVRPGNSGGAVVNQYGEAVGAVADRSACNTYVEPLQRPEDIPTS